MRVLFFALTAFATGTFAQAPAQPRGGSNEWSMHLLAIVGSSQDFEGGAAARIDNGLGIGLSAARNLNNYLSIGVEGTAAQLQYRATVAPGAANPTAGFGLRF